MTRAEHRRRARETAAGMARGLLAHRTLSEVGQLLGISPQRVGQIEKQALAKLARRPEIVRLAKEYGLGS